MRLIRYSEPRPATGAIGGTGALNTLGRPDLGFWALYVREALQNSWDAHRPGTRPIHVCLEARRLTAAHTAALRDHVLTSFPDDGRETVWRHLREHPVTVTITDTGTTGMGGPVRADVSGDTHHDFADFVWNIGQAPDKQLGGGTFGYGKSVHYRASRARTIVMHTRCITPNGLESRLIACSWGREYIAPDNRGRHVPHTGRHWWGVPGDEAPLTPLIGPDADRVAAALGLPDLTDTTGTTVMICAADVDDPGDWAAQTAAAVAWHCWPKIVDLGEGPDMAVTVVADGRPVPVPDPVAHPELQVFVAALRGILAGDNDRIRVRRLRPRTDTGWLTLRHHLRIPGTAAPGSGSKVGGGSDRSATPDGRPFAGPLRHVALLRAPRLVVRYLPGPDAPAPWHGWGGVFLADDEHDRAFASAEPPAHDDWVPQAVDNDRHRSIVKVSLKRIAEHVKTFVEPPRTNATGGGKGLGRIAGTLGDLLAVKGPGAIEPVSPAGAADTGTPGVQPAPPRRPSTVTVTRHHLEPDGDALLVGADLDVQLGAGVSRVRLAIDAHVVTGDGGALERSAPEGAAVPRPAGWILDGQHTGTAAVDIGPGTRRVTALIRTPRDTAVRLRARCQDLPGADPGHDGEPDSDRGGDGVRAGHRSSEREEPAGA